MTSDPAPFTLPRAHPDRHTAVAQLKRNVTLPLIILYGLGTILGAGIYVLTGVVAGRAGEFTPLAFFLAAVVASPTAFAYAELSARFPRSAGEAIYIDEAFGRRALTWLTGISVTAIGIVSAATISRGFVGYLDVFVVLPDWLVVLTIVVALGGLAAWGIMQSVVIAAVVTAIEILGLLLVNGIGLGAALEAGSVAIMPTTDLALWSGVLAGAFLAFYAFIGFEDIVNIAEETRAPSRNVPLAIIVSLVICTLLYVLTTFVAVRTVPLTDLAGSKAPMALVVERNSTWSPATISFISMLAVVNGALVQMIMASRVLYGMANMSRLPAWLADVNPTTQTPLKATAIVVAIVLLLALFLDVEALASITSSLTLLVFAAINLALLVIKYRYPPPKSFAIPLVVPAFGLVTSLALFAASFIRT